MKRFLKILAAALLALIIMSLTAVFVLTRTEIGTGWVLGIAQGQLEGLEIGVYRGTIRGGLELREIRFGSEDFLLSADRLETVLRTDWFPFVLVVERLEADRLDARVLDAIEESESEGLPESFALPFRLELPHVRLSGITVREEGDEPLFEAQSLEITASVHRRLQIHDLKLSVAEGGVTAGGRMDLAQPFELDFRIETALEVPIEDEPEPLFLELAATASGALDDIAVAVGGTANPPRFGSHSFNANSLIGPTGMKTGRFELSGPDLNANGSGSVDWEGMSAHLEAVHLEIPGTGFVADADLSTDLESERLDGRVTWSGLTWPLRGKTVQWASREGKVRLSGSLDDWALDGQVELEAPGYPGGRLHFDASGDRGGLEAVVHEAEILGGRVRGTGAYRWDGGGVISAELALQDLATAGLAPDYPAVLSGELAASGRLEPLGVSLDVRNLHGEALGKPVSANGRIEIGENAVRAEEFSIRSGASSLLMNGFPDAENGLVFTANIADLGDFLPGSTGRLDATGTLFLESGWPVLDIEASGSDVGWRDVHATSLKLSGGPDSFAVSLADTLLGETRLEQIDARIVLDSERQAADIDAVSGERRVSARLAGAIESGGQGDDHWKWMGELQALELLLNEQDHIRLQEPAALRFAADRVRLETGCLAGSRGATACLEAEWSARAGTEAAAEIGRWPLDIISEILGLQVRFSQRADGSIQMTFPPSGRPSGSADFRISGGSLTFSDDPDPILETGEGALAFTLTDGRLTSGVIDIPIPGQGLIDVDYEVPDVTMGLGAELRGTLLVDMSDLDLISVFVPRADRVAGVLKAELALSGTLGQPYFRGQLDLENGVLENQASGLRLEDIELSGKLVGNGEALLTGGFRAAEGVGSLEALIDLRNIQEPKFELGVTGEKLKLFNSSNLMVVVDPQLKVTLRPGVVTIDGDISIPSALVAPNIIPEKTVGESPDLVITAGRPSGDEIEPRESLPVSILGGLSLALGDDVKLDLSVAELGVAGDVGFDWEGGLIPFADGSFNLSGEILAFGQLLEIAQGTISFPNAPANNPHLNIRAEREIFGNSEVRRAGLLITGTLRRPVVEPYTDPITNRDRAQTLLVTGSDFNMERGVGAVDIGTYIAPRIFVSYGVGVFDDQNVVSVRYDLGRGWGVKATSGERQTGVDISYTVDQ